MVWGTTFVVSDNALRMASPAVLTVGRFIVAAAVLLFLARHRSGLSRAIRFWSVALLGLTGVSLNYGLQNAGLLYTTAGTAALLQAVLPIATVLLGWIWLTERPGGVSAVGLLLSTAGVVLVAGGAILRLDLGALLVLGGVFGYALYTVMLRARRDEDVLVLAAATCLWGLMFLLPWQLWEIVTGRASLHLDAALVTAILYLGVLASGGTLLLWTYGATRVPVTVAAVFLALIPAVGYAVAALTGEALDLGKTIGCVLALAGTLLVIAAAPSRLPKV